MSSVVMLRIIHKQAIISKIKIMQYSTFEVSSTIAYVCKLYRPISESIACMYINRRIEITWLSF